MKEYSKTTIAVLRVIVAEAGATIARIDDIAGGKGKTTMANLCARGMCTSRKVNGVRVYTAKSAGLRLLTAADGQMGDVPGPRMLSTEVYVPQPCPPARARAMDAYGLPSLDAGRQIERRAPGIMSSHIPGAYLP